MMRWNGKNLLAALQENGDYRVSVCLQLIRREFLLENEIWFYEGIIHEDNLFTFEVLMKAERARCIHNIYYYRRMRSSSTMTKKKTSANLRGYYISVIEHIKIAAKEDFTVKQHAVVIKIIRNLLKNLEKIYNTIDMEEKDRFLKQCSCEEKYLFEGIFMTYLEELNRLTRVCQDTAKQKQDNHESIEQEFCWSRKIRTGKRVLKQEGMKGFLRLILYKVSTRLERFGFFWLIKNRGILYTWYRAKLKIAPSKICVSIIIPVYNAEKYLDACLQSIMNQSLKQIEVICVNDGSTDRSMEILNRYKSKDSRFKIIEQDKQGAGAARNKGIAYAKGEYLLFLDADDLFSPELCNTAYFQSKKDKAQVCLFGAQRYDMKDKRMEKMDWVLRENEIPNGVFSAADISKSIFQITTGCPWSKMFSRKYVLNNKLQYQNLKNSNDVFFVRTACAAAERITAVKGSVLVTYRYHGGQNIQSLKMKAPLEFYKAFQALKEELKRRGLYSLMEQSFVNMALQESLFNLETAGSKKAQKVVEELLVREGFAYLELEKYDQEYFYDTKKYEEYLKIINDCKN